MYRVVIYYETNLVEIQFEDIISAKDYYNNTLNSTMKSDFKAHILELHSKTSGLILRYIDNFEFYEIM